jgi:hypothetical protein
VVEAEVPGKVAVLLVVVVEVEEQYIEDVAQLTVLPIRAEEAEVVAVKVDLESLKFGIFGIPSTRHPQKPSAVRCSFLRCLPRMWM